MRKLFQENRLFIIGYLLILISAFLLKLIFSKEEIFISINAQHCSFGDLFFQYITYIGDGVFEAGQSYVALSRVKSLEGLSISSYDVSKILVNKRVKLFYGSLVSPDN